MLLPIRVAATSVPALAKMGSGLASRVWGSISSAWTSVGRGALPSTASVGAAKTALRDVALTSGVVMALNSLEGIDLTDAVSEIVKSDDPLSTLATKVAEHLVDTHLDELDADGKLNSGADLEAYATQMATVAQQLDVIIRVERSLGLNFEQLADLRKFVLMDGDDIIAANILRGAVNHV